MDGNGIAAHWRRIPTLGGRRVVLAPLADMLNALGGDTLAIKLISAVLGVGMMAVLAAWLDWNKQLNATAQ